MEWRIKTTISLPVEWEEKVKEILRSEGYKNYADYIRTLIREDLKRRGLITSPEG